MVRAENAALSLSDQLTKINMSSTAHACAMRENARLEQMLEVNNGCAEDILRAPIVYHT